MKDKANQLIARWHWTVRYRFATLRPIAKLLLLGCLTVQVLLIIGVFALEQRKTDLQRSLQQSVSETLQVEPSAGQAQQALIDSFQTFLPPAAEAERISASFNQAAEEVGLTIDKLSSQPGNSQAKTFQRHNYRLQMRGENGKVERFILLSLLENDALLLRRWSYQSPEAQATSPSSTLDFELLVKPQ